ncbi:MAG: zf-HC2 domain-containing protein [Armatimonadota bacterium]|nr:zf-HC2 domain-containing protein [Armatimonadota bacterium]
MNCGKVQASISDYVDGRLPERETLEFEKHIGSCPICAGELDETRRMVSALRSLAVPRSPVDLWPQVRESIQAAERPAPAWSFLVRPVLIAPAAIAAAAAAAMLILPLPKQVPENFPALSASEYRGYVTEHLRFQKRPFADPDVVFTAVELDRTNIRTNGE